MNTRKIILLTSLLAAIAALPAMARGPGGNGRGGGNGGVCPYGFEPGSGMGCGLGAGAGVCDGTQQRLRLRDGSCLLAAPDGVVTPGTQMRGNPNSNGTPLRDGSGRATAPGKGPKDGTGNNPRHPVAPTPQG